MGKYNFDELVSRSGTGCVKWDLYPGKLPLWVADMDFKTAPAIIEALDKRVQHGVFGYPLVPDAYFASTASWFDRRHGWSGIKRENIIPTTGVIAAYSAAIKAVTTPGDKVIAMTPCYNQFFPAIRNNKCVLAENRLVYNEGGYTIDWEDLEAKAADAKALLFCNPHNPVGRVWTREELLKVADICHRHGVFVISDEIHCEFTYPGHDYTPWAVLPEEYVKNSVSCISPTKAFNIAGIQIANIFAADKDVYAKVDRAINDNECCDVNVFGITALMAAYDRSEDWLDALREYLYDNARTVFCYLEDRLPMVNAVPLEGTYLMWLDFRALLKDGEPLEGFCDRLSANFMDYGLVLSPGTIYGAAGEGFMRLNIACPRSRLLAALEVLEEAIHSLL